MYWQKHKKVHGYMYKAFVFECFTPASATKKGMKYGLIATISHIFKGFDYTIHC